MKEATGELNMTVITVVIVAALGVIGATVVLPAIQNGLRNNARCAAAACDACAAGARSTTCVYYETNDAGGTTTRNIQCPCN